MDRKLVIRKVMTNFLSLPMPKYSPCGEEILISLSKYFICGCPLKKIRSLFLSCVVNCSLLHNDTALRLTTQVSECIEDKTNKYLHHHHFCSLCGARNKPYIALACGALIQLNAKSPDKMKMSDIELTFYNIPCYFAINCV